MKLDPQDDLVERARTGDRSAYSALVERYWEPLCRWLQGLSGSAHLAEDLAQDAFVLAWSALPTLKEVRAFRAWLFRIAHNAWMLHQRGARPPAADGLAGAGATADPSASPVDVAIEAEALAALQRAVARLPESYRAAYLLWSREEFPYEEIARILGITQVNARWRVSEARRMLVEKLGKYLEPNK